MPPFQGGSAWKITASDSCAPNPFSVLPAALRAPDVPLSHSLACRAHGGLYLLGSLLNASASRVPGPRRPPGKVLGREGFRESHAERGVSFWPRHLNPACAGTSSLFGSLYPCLWPCGQLEKLPEGRGICRVCCSGLSETGCSSRPSD